MQRYFVHLLFAWLTRDVLKEVSEHCCCCVIDNTGQCKSLEPRLKACLQPPSHSHPTKNSEAHSSLFVTMVSETNMVLIFYNTQEICNNLSCGLPIQTKTWHNFLRSLHERLSKMCRQIKIYRMKHMICWSSEHCPAVSLNPVCQWVYNTNSV